MTRSSHPTLKQLWETGRPPTGLYGFLLALVSFKFFGWHDIVLGLFVATIFSFITMSIMRFNDLIDRHNDVRKHKYFATRHYAPLKRFWLVEAEAILLGLIVIGYFDWLLALFCLGVWLVGLLYSFVPHWFVVQNVIVALCSGSPALCGMVHARMFEWQSVMTFLTFTALILVNEIYKDVQDRRSDMGYKVTLPTEYGPVETLLFLVAALHPVGYLFHYHPNSWMLVAAVLLPYLAYQQGVALRKPELVDQPMKAMNTMIKVIGVILYAG